MDKKDIQCLVDVRTHLIKFFNSLEGKNEPTALIKQTRVAHQLTAAILEIDKILEGKVNFS